MFVCALAYLPVWVDGELNHNATHTQFTIPAISFADEAVVSGNPILKSPMPGKVMKVTAAAGSKVKVGDKIIVLEAMKMEHVISAPCDG